MFSEEFNPETKNVVTGDTDSIFLELNILLNKNKDEDGMVQDVLGNCDKIQKYLPTRIR